MTLTLPNDARLSLINELCLWTSKPPKTSLGSFKLKHWQCMAGWFNWALNIYPLLCPVLNNVYAKMANKGNKERVYINNAIQEDLLWAVNHLEHSDGIHLFKSFRWTPTLANFTIYCDACPEGMGFWYPLSKDGYNAPTPVNVPTNAIFYFKTLCVLSALEHVQTRATHGSKILIYTNNRNTVDIFQALHCLPPYNHLLKAAIDIILQNDYSLCVIHVPGEQNVVTDALSRVHFSIALRTELSLSLFSFHPPRLVGSTL